VHEVARLATGPDAKDVAFATIFGPARMLAMSPVLTVIGRTPDAPQPPPWAEHAVAQAL
jgi:hypothetical protein